MSTPTRRTVILSLENSKSLYSSGLPQDYSSQDYTLTTNSSESNLHISLLLKSKPLLNLIDKFVKFSYKLWPLSLHKFAHNKFTLKFFLTHVLSFAYRDRIFQEPAKHLSGFFHFISPSKLNRTLGNYFD
ncbi:129aa long hypothetical protein [Pyrococcus horikoshii OT3]|uniref:Uncharacterized protein n=1 Tax=Pyrococcus horikoshii (strain ATCC 700860 / DSM 12428 / JCM 9974 / NBRC 100139 / OT-3) TaxID=70601 RepID=O59337_PYRHO|nr:129aa long hypothetical protein [Pyrococcus horikoshii OT3]